MRVRGAGALRAQLSPVLLASVLLGASWTAAAAELDLGRFQRADGAITVQRPDAGGAVPVIDPYFSAKALLAALDLGLDVTRVAHAWIGWMLPHQHPDGRLERWCVKAGSDVRCAAADADDAALAVWIELLLRLYPTTAVPVTWQVSLDNAERYLAELRTPAGYYIVSHELPVGLLMDNAEVYSALAVRARHATTQRTAAARADADLARLERAITQTFWHAGRGAYRPSTQAHRAGSFYPEATAQLYPLLAGMRYPGAGDSWKPWFEAWKKRHAHAWQHNARHDYPWGLVALAAWKLGDGNTAACWLQRAALQRDTARWNVLEEAIFRGLSQHRTMARCVAGAM